MDYSELKETAEKMSSTLADLRRGARDVSPGVQILSLSCSFWKKI